MNASFQAIKDSGLPFRIATQRGGVARAYIGSAGRYVEFMSNNANSTHLMAYAEKAMPHGHLGRALKAIEEMLCEVEA